MTEMQFDLLAIRNETFLTELIYHEEVGSTNSELTKLASKPLQSPVLVLAGRQTDGRGRGSNRWWSHAGSLTFSLLLDFPMLAPERLNSFALTTGLAICQALERHAPAADLAIKWPNDVYLQGRKVAGILIERPDAKEPRLIIGVGINANNSFADAPEDVRQRATSLVTELGDPVDLTLLLIDCLQQLEQRSRDHIHHPSELLDQWRAYCMLTNRRLQLDSGGQVVSGLCRGIDASGALLLETNEGILPMQAGTVLTIE